MKTWVRKVRVNDLEDGGVMNVIEFIVILEIVVISLPVTPVKVVLVVVFIVEFVLAKPPECSNLTDDG